MSKMNRLKNSKGEPIGYMIYCPGCGHHHGIPVEMPLKENGPKWTFNGNQEKPTFTPSFNAVGECHFNLIDGKMHFCQDCNHKLAGQVVELLEI